MNSSASRGAILIALAVVIGAIVLAKGFDGGGSSATVGTTGNTDDITADEPAAEVTTNSEGAAVGEADINGDGIAVPAIDTTGDGELDTEAEDTDGDGVVDSPVTDDTTPLAPVAHDPSEVRVLVANATSVNGAAANATSKLVARNYLTLDPTNADDSLEATIIYFDADFDADAQLVAQILSAQPDQLLPMPATDPAGVDRRGANILVMLGTDNVTQAPEADG